MSDLKKKNPLSAAAFLAVVSFGAAAPTSSFAAESVDDRINACVSALEAAGEISAADDYKVRFKGERGGRLKQLTIMLKPVSTGASNVSATCKIKKGEVLEYSLTA